MPHLLHKASLRGPTEGPNRPEPTREAIPSLILTLAQPAAVAVGKLKAAADQTLNLSPPVSFFEDCCG
jgi:hypothetical protein